MKYLFILGIVSWWAIKPLAQQLTILDRDNREPLGQVTIIGDRPGQVATSDEEGRVDLTLFQNSREIQFNLLGYSMEVRSYEELERSNFLLLMEVSSIKMDEIIISGTRWNQALSDVPAKISHISPKEIVIQNPQSAADMLAVSGEVFIQKSQQGGGSPMIRGFATNRLLYSVDGVRMNTAIFRGGNLQNVISLDPLAIDRTEILFGPASAIYGSDAIGAVMSFQTLHPRLAFRGNNQVSGKALVRYSTANMEKTVHADINLGWEKWALVTSASYSNYGDLRMGTNGPPDFLRPQYVQRVGNKDIVTANENQLIQVPSAYNQLNIMQKIRYRPNEQWNVNLDFHYSETSDYSRYDRHLRTLNDLPLYGEWYYGPQIWMMHHWHIAHSRANAVYDKMTFRFARQYFQESRISRDFDSTKRERRKEEVYAYSANMDFIKSLAASHKLFYGVEYIVNDVVSTGIDEMISDGSTVPGPSRYPQARWTSFGIYAAHQFRATEKTLLQSSTRFSHFGIDAHFNTDFYPFPFDRAELGNESLTGSIGIVHRPSSNWVISANAATAFRSPNVDDMGKVFDSEPGSVVVPNPELNAEYAWNFDFEIAKSIRDLVKINVSGFYTHLSDAMVRRDFTLNGMDSIFYNGELSRVQAIQNAAQTKVYGLQMGIDLMLGKFGFVTDYNLQIGNEELDDGTKSSSRHAPPWFGVTRLSYANDQFYIEFYSEYSGQKKFRDLPIEEIGKPEIYAKDENGQPWSPGWHTINLKAQYKVRDKYSLQVGLENISDQRYRPYSSGIAAPGRNLILSARVEF